jgi:hypothetical protein
MAVTADGWTVAEAREQFARTGLPVDGLDQIIRALPGFTRIGETRSGKKGGRGQALYEIKELQLLHGALARWLTPPPG